MSGVVEAEEEAVPESVIPEEIEKIVVKTETVKAVFKAKYGRDVEKIVYDPEEELWTIDFLKPSEIAKEEPSDSS